MAVSLSSASLALANASPTSVAQEDPTTAALNKLSPALGKAHERVRSQLQSDSTSLSQLGQYKATVSNLSVAAQALGQLDASTSVTSGVQTVERFVAAYNQAIVASQAGASGDTANTLAASRRHLTNTETSRSQLAKLGLSRQPDGTLKLDTTALKNALSAGSASATASGATSTTSAGLSTLAQLGKAIGKRAASELSSSSRIATATSLYTDKASLLKRQQSRLQEVATQLAAQASTTASTSSTSDWRTQQALRTYTS